MQRLWEIRIDSVNRRIGYLERMIERELLSLREEMRREFSSVDREFGRLGERLGRHASGS